MLWNRSTRIERWAKATPILAPVVLLFWTTILMLPFPQILPAVLIVVAGIAITILVASVVWLAVGSATLLMARGAMELAHKIRRQIVSHHHPHNV